MMNCFPQSHRILERYSSSFYPPTLLMFDFMLSTEYSFFLSFSFSSESLELSWIMSNQRWSSYWPLPSPRRPRCPSSVSSSSSAFPSPNPSFPGNSDSENGEISGKVAKSASLRVDAPTRGFAWWRRGKQKEHPDIPGHLKRFSLRELQVATNNFSSKNIVGRGGFGSVFKGRLRDGSLVAVKIIQNRLIAAQDLQFQVEVELISMVAHPNILHIRGFCTTPTEHMLVYPFMANGSVASRLVGLPPLKPRLAWSTRRRIALGSARGLSYLHEHCDPKIVHRDVKAANIYLDEEDEAVVGDFGLAKLMDYNDTHVTTAVRGTLGHIAPEYLITGKCTEKTDVFSYGMMLLELITGKRIHELAQLANDDDVMLLYWLKDILEEKRHGMLVDPSIQDDYIEEEVVSLFQISQLCIQGSANDRPKMSEVVRMFEGYGLTERWEEWQRVGVSRPESDMAPHRIEDLTVDSDDDLDGHVLSSPR